MAKVSIIGLCGESVFLSLDEFPIPSVTKQACCIHKEPGGKGYNQAVACKKFGVDVSFFTKIGNDDAGKSCINYLEENGIKAEYSVDDKLNTPYAVILTTENENEVIVHKGSISNLDVFEFSSFEDEIKNSDILLLQYELPIEIIKYSIKIAKKHGCKIILNPAPAVYDDLELLNSCDIVTPNYEEAKKIYYATDSNLEEQIKKQAKNVCIVTLGKNGSMLVKDNSVTYFDAIKVSCKDTTGAGDIFNAGLARSLALNKTLEESIKFATVASGLSTTKPFVLDSIPTIDSINEILNNLGSIILEKKA